MKLLELNVPDEVASRIEEAAQLRGLTVEQLLQYSVEEKLQRDAEFSRAVDHVIEKNAELYRRLS
ncbi:MAG: DNA-binding protein [Acidobacteria bacterium]|nr:DNA-binding protein [Acidobacteriota bacterium]MBV9185531.1 DNA-binding protein [Acidobacteriota bacterium]